MLLNKKRLAAILLFLATSVTCLWQLLTPPQTPEALITAKGESAKLTLKEANSQVSQAQFGLQLLDACQALERRLSGLLHVSMAVSSNTAEQTRKEAIVAYLQQTYKQPNTTIRHYVDLAWQHAQQYDMIEPELLLAVMQKESSLRANSRSSYGAQGLMQVVPRWHPEKLKRGESALSPEVNVRVGTQILGEYWHKARGDWIKTLKKYSGGARNYPEIVLKNAVSLVQLGKQAKREKGVSAPAFCAIPL